METYSRPFTWLRWSIASRIARTRSGSAASAMKRSHHAVLSLGLRDAGLDDPVFCADAEVHRVAGFLRNLLQEQALGAAIAFWKRV